MYDREVLVLLKGAASPLLLKNSFLETLDNGWLKVSYQYDGRLMEEYFSPHFVIRASARKLPGEQQPSGLRAWRNQ